MYLSEVQSRQLFKKILTFIFILMIIGCDIVFAKASPTVLILNSYHKEFKWTDDQVDSAKKVLRDEFKEIEILVEYMDTKRIYTDEYLRTLEVLYKLKYKNIRFDAIITTDDNALWFALKHRKELFKDAPISFCGINNFRKFVINKFAKVSGIIEVLDIVPNINLILKFHPHTKKIVVLVDSTPTGIGQLRDIKQAAQQYPQLDFEYIEGENYTHKKLFQKLQSLPQDAIVLLAVWLKDKNGEYLSSAKGGKLISNNSTVPVYGIIDMYFGEGIVGGKLLDSSTHGRIAAETAVKFIKKEKTTLIIKSSKNPYMFDYDQLVKWEIKQSDLPKNSIIINKPFSFYSKYKTLTNSIVSIVIILILILVYLIFNITQRKKTEKKLQESEQKFRNGFQHHSAVKLLINPENGEILEANDAAEIFYGYSVAELKKMKIQEFNVLSDDQTKKKMLNAKMGIENHFLFKHQLADGSTRDVEIFSSAIEIDGNSLLHSIVHDVTDRKVAERNLKQSESKFRKVFDLSPQAIALTESKSGRLLDVNKKLCELTYYQKDELIGRETTELNFYSLEDRNRFVTELKENGKVDALEMIFNAKNGETITALMYATLINVSGQDLILTIFANITEQKKLESQLSQSQKMESIGILAGGISHDFNNILFPIVGHSEMLLEDVPDDSPYWESINEIHTGALRARDLVQQILAFSRQGSSELKLMKMQPIIKEALKMIRSTIPTTISISQNLQSDCGVVEADPTQIHQIVMNLATNAYHAMEENGGELNVILKEIELGQHEAMPLGMAPGSYACLTIVDTGTGMNKETINKIFDPFFTTKEKGKGTGMGLSVVHGIVKSMNGEIQVYSELGKGTQFHIYLPVVVSASEKQDLKAKEPIQGGTESVLLVDDEEGIITMEKQALERLGYHVTSRTSSLEALEAFRVNPNKFDLVITDKAMPNMPGEKLAAELIKIRFDIPVLLCTGFSESVTEEKIKSLGIKGLLLKPIIIRDLAKKMREVLDGEII